MSANVQIMPRFSNPLELIPVSSSGGKVQVSIVSLQDFLNAEEERHRKANIATAARVNVTKLKAMLEELKQRKLSDEDDEA